MLKMLRFLLYRTSFLETVDGQDVVPDIFDVEKDIVFNEMKS